MYDIGTESVRMLPGQDPFLLMLASFGKTTTPSYLLLSDILVRLNCDSTAGITTRDRTMTSHLSDPRNLYKNGLKNWGPVIPRNRRGVMENIVSAYTNVFKSG